MRARVVGTALVTAMLAAAGCGDTNGIVELHWQFDDAKLRRIYPLGSESDTCALVSASGETYDLRVQLSVVENTPECVSDVSQAGCQVLEMEMPMLFPCNRPRGTALEVPSSAVSEDEDPGYLMVVEPVIVTEDGESFVPVSSCVAAPGPRVRRVRPGRITDLEIYQFVLLGVDIDGQPLDLDLCRP